MRPPWSSMILCVRASPSPVPLSLVREERVEHPVGGLRGRSPPRCLRPRSARAARAAGLRPPVTTRSSVPAQPTRRMSRPPVGHGVERVADEVDERLIERRRRRPRSPAGRARTRASGVTPRLSSSWAHRSTTRSSSAGSRTGREAQAGRPGQLEQSLDDAVDALQLVRHDRLELGSRNCSSSKRRVRWRLKVQQRGQRVLDLVGEAGGQAAQGGQPVGATQAVLQLAHDGEIAQHRDHAEILALAALERRRADLDRRASGRCGGAGSRSGRDRPRGWQIVSMRISPSWGVAAKTSVQ